MRIKIYIPELIENDKFLIGGVQTYLFSLLDVLNLLNCKYQIITIGDCNKEIIIEGISITKLTQNNWINNKTHLNQNDINLSLLSHYSPKNLVGKSIGIQHGVYWDRPIKNIFLHNKLRRFEHLLNLFRSYIYTKKSLKFDKLVCVDTIFPAVASTVFSPLPWHKIEYIPNFSPCKENTISPIQKIEEIVFSRRFVEHRGSKILVRLIKSLRKDQINIPIKIYGSGPDEAYIQNALNGEKKIYISQLSYNFRLEAFHQNSLVLIPTLSTEGTSLTCIEAMASGSTVIATCVGGLSNLIIDKHNGFLCKPTTDCLDKKIREILKSDITEINRVRKNSFNTFQSSFSFEVWKEKWIDLLKKI